MSPGVLMFLLVVTVTLLIYIYVSYLRLQLHFTAQVQAEVAGWRDRELAAERTRITAQIGEDKRLELEGWKSTHTDSVRQDAIQRSQAAVTGRVFEQLVPYMPDFSFNPKDARFIGSPIDFLVFDGLSDEDVRRIVFVEVKTGSSSLSTRERRVRDAVKALRVEWLELRLPDVQKDVPDPTPLLPAETERPGPHREPIASGSSTMPEPMISTSHDGEPVSPALRPLLLAVYDVLHGQPVDPTRLRATLETLLEYLSSPAGRTHANCCAADLFFCQAEGWDIDGWDVPDAIGDILGDMAQCLHDTIRAPEIAADFESTPEQLLKRLRVLPQVMPHQGPDAAGPAGHAGARPTRPLS